MRQERVLLRLVEAVDLVDEEDGPLGVDALLLCGGRDDLPKGGHAAEDRAERLETR